MVHFLHKTTVILIWRELRQRGKIVVWEAPVGILHVCTTWYKFYKQRKLAGVPGGRLSEFKKKISQKRTKINKANLQQQKESKGKKEKDGKQQQ